MRQVIISRVLGSSVVTTEGRTLRVIGNIPIRPGMRMWTDERVVFGNVRQRGTVVSSVSTEWVIPVVGLSLTNLPLNDEYDIFRMDRTHMGYFDMEGQLHVEGFPYKMDVIVHKWVSIPAHGFITLAEDGVFIGNLYVAWNENRNYITWSLGDRVAPFEYIEGNPVTDRDGPATIKYLNGCTNHFEGYLDATLCDSAGRVVYKSDDELNYGEGWLVRGIERINGGYLIRDGRKGFFIVKDDGGMYQPTEAVIPNYTSILHANQLDITQIGIFKMKKSAYQKFVNDYKGWAGL